MGDLISVSIAKQLIRENTSPLGQVMVPLDDAAGLILADDIIAPVDIPSYPQSSMDGYAINMTGWKIHGSLQVQGVIAAGSSENKSLENDQAARIFTGAAVPSGTDTVIMQEHALVKDNYLVSIGPNPVEVGANVRAVGSEVMKGTIALPANSFLTPGAIGFLAGMGIDRVPVVPKPRVAVIVTGNELLTIGAPLTYGMVYDSNSHSLTAALRSIGSINCQVYHAHDSPDHLQEILAKAIETNDMVILTGGVSVGDYDHVIGAAKAAGVEKVFHKVRQKPGKPIFYGQKGDKPVFGLPGNPASVLTCFYQYVTIAISRLTSCDFQLPVRQAELMGDYLKPIGITHFLKGIYNGQTVFLPEGQESYKMNSFARANCIVEIPDETAEVKKGQKVAIYRII